MKKSLLSLAIVFGIVSNAFAGMNAGIHTGLNMSNLSVSAGGVSLSGNSTTKFMVGAYLETQLAESIYLQPELNYVGRGVDGATNNPSYLDIPLLLKGKFNAGSVFPFVHAGPVFGLKVSGDGYKGTNFALDLGAGLEIPATSTVNVGLDARYLLGLSSITDTDPISTKTKDFMILASVSFAL